jgi:hypothetical protein
LLLLSKFGLVGSVLRARGGLTESFSRLSAGDHGILLPHHYGFPMVLRDLDTSNMNLFLEDQPTLDDDNFFDDRQDCGVASSRTGGTASI